MPAWPGERPDQGRLIPYRVGILGMGNVAAGYDKLGSGMARSHVAGILSDPRLMIALVSDIDRDKAAAEVRRFSIAAEVVGADELLTADLDVLCIATPDGTHLDFLQRAAAGRMRMVLVEKPVDGSRAQRQAVLAALAARGKALAVNHTRRWIPGMTQWISNAREGKYGRPLSAVVRYNRGLRHNGIHAFDLIGAFVGTQVENVASLADSIADYSAQDLTRTLQITLRHPGGQVPLSVFGVDGRVQTIFEVDILFERARIVVTDDAGAVARLYETRPGDYEGFAPELRLSENYHDSRQRLFADVWRNVADHLETGAALAGGGADMFAGYDLLDEICSRLPQ